MRPFAAKFLPMNLLLGVQPLGCRRLPDTLKRGHQTACGSWPQGARKVRGILSLIVLTGLGMGTKVSFGSDILSDIFNYPDGFLVEVAGAKWTTHSGAARQVEVASGGIILRQTETEDVSAVLEGRPYAPAGAVPALYCGFRVRFTALPSSVNGSYFAHFKDGGNGFRARVWALTAGASSGSFRLGISASGAAASAVFPQELSMNTDYRLVVRHHLASSAGTLWLNPTLESDSAVTSLDAQAAISISAFAFRQSSGTGNLIVDDLRVGTEFSDVVIAQSPPLTPPVITQQPASQSVNAGSNVLMLVVATGSEPLSYQWQRGGVNVAGAIGSSLAFTDIQPADAGTYTVVVSNSAGAVTSSSAVLAVLQPDLPPVITVVDDQTAVENGLPITIPFHVEDAQTPADQLVLGASSSNSILLPDQSIAVVGSGADRTLILSPIAGFMGTATVTITSSDGLAASSQRFRLTVAPALPRYLRVADAVASPGAVVSVPVELWAQGGEQTVQFSLAFDPDLMSLQSVLLANGASGAGLEVNESQTGAGRVGVTISLPGNQTWTLGRQPLIIINFTVNSFSAGPWTTILIVDEPVPRQVNATPGPSLPASYLNGVVYISTGYEGDVAPRPNGDNDGTITITDWVQIGRFAAGLDIPATGAEFQRADCAPRVDGGLLVLGNGVINITDWVQAGRYAAGLDVPTAMGGPLAPLEISSLEFDPRTALTKGSGANPALIVTQIHSPRSGEYEPLAQEAKQPYSAFRTMAVEIEFESTGNENALGFSLSFDPVALRFVEARLVSDRSGAVFQANARFAANGQLGFAIANTPGQCFLRGRMRLLRVHFVALPSRWEEFSRVEFSDQVVQRAASTAQAGRLSVNCFGDSIRIDRSLLDIRGFLRTAATDDSRPEN